MENHESENTENTEKPQEICEINSSRQEILTESSIQHSDINNEIINISQNIIIENQNNNQTIPNRNSENNRDRQNSRNAIKIILGFLFTLGIVLSLYARNINQRNTALSKSIIKCQDTICKIKFICKKQLSPDNRMQLEIIDFNGSKGKVDMETIDNLHWHKFLTLNGSSNYKYQCIESQIPKNITQPKYSKIRISNLTSFPEVRSLKILSYNIRYENELDVDNSWDSRKFHVIDLIRKHNPDIFALQEASLYQYLFVTWQFPEYGKVFTPRDGFGDEGCPIFYRENDYELIEYISFWISDTPDRVSLSFFGYHHRVVTHAKLKRKADNITLSVLNVHADYGANDTIKKKSWNLILSHINQNAANVSNIIFLGDLNANITDPTLNVIKNAGFIDTYDTYDEDGIEKEKVATWHDWKGGLYEGEKLDYIFVSEKMQPLEFHIDRSKIQGADMYPSDHYPIVAVVRPVV